MTKYFLLAIILLILVVLKQTRNQRVFKEEIYGIYEQLKKELGYSGVHGDPFDNAKDFLRDKSLSLQDLEKLETLLTVNTTNNNLSTQIGTITATAVITLITLAFGTMFSAILSGLYSNYAQLFLTAENEEKIYMLFQVMDRIVEFSGWEFVFIAWILLSGISIWNIISTDRNQTNVVLQKIVTDEIQELKKK